MIHIISTISFTQFISRRRLRINLSDCTACLACVFVHQRNLIQHIVSFAPVESRHYCGRRCRVVSCVTFRTSPHSFGAGIRCVEVLVRKSFFRAKKRGLIILVITEGMILPVVKTHLLRLRLNMKLVILYENQNFEHNALLVQIRRIRIQNLNQTYFIYILMRLGLTIKTTKYDRCLK